MKKFKFLFLAVLIAVMPIGCAQPTDGNTPIIPAVETSEPEAQPTIVNVTVTKISDSNNYVLDSETTIKRISDNAEFTILNTSTPIGTYTDVFFPDEIELEYSNGEKRIVSINQCNEININISSFSEPIKFNGLLDIFLNGLATGNIVIKWTTFYKYK